MKTSSGHIDDSAKETSGYFEELPSEYNLDLQSLVPGSFRDIKKMYVSKAGPTQLLEATRYGKRFVLKCLKEEFRIQPFYQLTLAKEFEIGISLDHPNIVKTIGYEDIEGVGKAIVMEYVDGETLRDILDNRQLTSQRARSIALQLVRAIEYLHSKQVIHRDLKPENVMITHSGSIVKLIDFSLSDSTSFTMIKIPSGTAGYTAPEQMRPGAKADVRGDIFSFGILLKELGEKADDPDLIGISRICTNLNPEARPQSIEDLDITSYLSRKKRKPTSLVRSAGLTVCLAALLMILTAITAFLGYKRYTAGKDPAVSENSYPAADDTPEVVDFELWNDKEAE